MSDIDGVSFQPWVGNLYGRANRFGVRLLILGESHYGDAKSAHPELTRNVIRSWAQQKRDRFFTVIANTLISNRGWISDEERASVWEHVAFYNLVQELVSGPRQEPSFRQYVEAQQPFHRVLERLEPHAVLVLGYRTADHILDWPEKTDYAVISHPSSRFRYNDAIPTFQTLVDRSRRRTSSPVV